MGAKKISYKLVAPDDEEGRPIYAMVRRLIERHHEHLTNARIAVAWNLTWQPDVDGRCTLGKAKKASDLDRELAPYDCVIMLRHEFFASSEVTDAQREALIDHELCHLEVELDGHGEPKLDTKGRTVYRIRRHDLEEFSAVVARHGMWRKDIEAFGALLERARKTDGKTPAELEHLRDQVVAAGIENEALELLRRVQAGEDREAVVDEILVRKLAKNPRLRRALEAMRPREGSVTISSGGKSVTLHADGRTEHREE